MSFWQKLLGSEQPQHKDPGLLLPELLKNYRAEKQLQKQILAHADISPNPSSNEQLRTAAGEQEKIAGRLEDKISDLGGTCEEEKSVPKGGRNHWERVVSDLEASQRLTQRYNEQAIFWDPDIPEATIFFLSLERDKHVLNAFLRDIALRADPHAIN